MCPSPLRALYTSCAENLKLWFQFGSRFRQAPFWLRTCPSSNITFSFINSKFVLRTVMAADAALLDQRAPARRWTRGAPDLEAGEGREEERRGEGVRGRGREGAFG